MSESGKMFPITENSTRAIQETKILLKLADILEDEKLITIDEKTKLKGLIRKEQLT